MVAVAQLYDLFVRIGLLLLRATGMRVGELWLLRQSLTGRGRIGPFSGGDFGRRDTR
jgi:hypothetical protein